MRRNDGSIRERINHIRDRLDDPPNMTDRAAIRAGFLDYIIATKQDIMAMVATK